jgi:hypothetical protein
VNGERWRFVLRTTPPFGLSLSKVRCLRSGPFDKLKMNGERWRFVLRTTPPFGLSLSKVRYLRSGPFDKLRVNGREGLRTPLTVQAEPVEASTHRSGWVCRSRPPACGPNEGEGQM